MPFQLLHPHLRQKSKPAICRPSAPKAASLKLLPTASRSNGIAAAAVSAGSQTRTSTTKVHRSIKLKPKGRLGAHVQQPKSNPRQTKLDDLLRSDAVTQSCSTSDGADCENRDAVNVDNLPDKCNGALPPPCYDDYIENLKHDVDDGTLDLRGCPWVHPSEPHTEVTRINSLRRTAGKTILDADEVRNVVFRPLVFMAAAGSS